MESTKNLKKNKSVKISVVIVNHNGGHFLDDALASLQAQQDVQLEIIVVDNASTDDSVSKVKRLFPKVKLLKRKTSTGFAAGNNLGLKHSSYNTILFMNPDIILSSPTILRTCYDRLEKDSHIGALTAKVELALKGTIDVTCHRGFPTPWRAFSHFTGLSTIFKNNSLFTGYYQSNLGYNTEHKVEAIGGMFMLMKRSVGEKVSWWDEDYPLYGEDLDLCYRLTQKGYYCYYFPKVTVLHYKGASTGMSKHSKEVTTASRETTKKVKAWSITAMQLFYNKHYKNKYPSFVTLLVNLGIKLLYFVRVKL